MPFGNIFPSLPWPFIDTAVRVVGFMGALAFIYAVLLEEEKHQDAVFMLAAASLFVYAWWANNPIFMFVSAGVFLVTGHQFIQIILHKHTHSTELIEEFKHPDHR